MSYRAEGGVLQGPRGGSALSETQSLYDGAGMRLKKTTTGGSTSIYPFGDDYEITDGVVTKYITVEGLGVIAKRIGSGPGANTHWLHYDRLGSIQAVTDGTGALVHRRSYRAYGEALGESGSQTESRGWIDQRNDPETGLTYLHARYYDPQLAVFLSPDPIGVAGGLHQYGYAFGNPVNGTDRSGLESCSIEDLRRCEEVTVHGGMIFGWDAWNYWVFHRILGIMYGGGDGGNTNGGGGGNDPAKPEPSGPKAPSPEDCPGGSCASTPVIIEPPETPGQHQPEQPRVIVPNDTIGPLEVGIYWESEVTRTRCGAIPPRPPDADLHANMREAASHLNPFWFRDQVNTGGPWDYKQERDYYEGFGNFNYGAAGSSFGFSDRTLKREAGRKQIESGTSRPSWGHPGARWNPWGGQPPYGDSPIDQEWIQRGIDYAHCQVPQ